MKYFLILMAVGWWATVAAAPQTAQTAAPGDDEEVLDLTPTKNKNRTCTTTDKRDGFCVDWSTCNPHNLTINTGGYIEQNGYERNGQCNPEEWCCVLESTETLSPTPIPNTVSPPHETPPPNTVAPSFETRPPNTVAPPVRGCRTGLPWSVAVYRDNPRNKSPELFCGGTVVSSRVVLTGATCALSFQRFDLWVRLPGGTRNYPVSYTLRHKKFNSGTQQNDIALLVLETDIEWPEGRRDDFGACVDLSTPLVGDCVAIGYGDSDLPTFTPMTVTENSCSLRRSTHDAACGRAIGSCSVTPGSPVLCPTSSYDLVFVGVVRQKCKDGSTTLGSLMGSAQWLSEKLHNLTLASHRYTTAD